MKKLDKLKKKLAGIMTFAMVIYLNVMPVYANKLMNSKPVKGFMDLCKDGTAVCQVAIGLLAVLAIGINWVKSRSAEEEEQGKYKKIRNEIVIGAIVAEVLIGGFFDTILSYFQ